jgi:nitrate reductase alpha subunit
VVNVLPRIEMIAVNEWWWSTSCEWADIVFAVDSWAELKHPDMTRRSPIPFLQCFPRTPMPRIFDTIGDIEVQAKVRRSWRSSPVTSASTTTGSLCARA